MDGVGQEFGGFTTTKPTTADFEHVVECAQAGYRDICQFSSHPAVEDDLDPDIRWRKLSLLLSQDDRRRMCSLEIHDFGLPRLFARRHHFCQSVYLFFRLLCVPKVGLGQDEARRCPRGQYVVHSGARYQGADAQNTNASFRTSLVEPRTTNLSRLGRVVPFKQTFASTSRSSHAPRPSQRRTLTAPSTSPQPRSIW
jgi:hypothetical protein